MLLQENIC